MNKKESLNQLRGGNTNHHKSKGEITQILLNNLGVVSPETRHAIQIKPGLSITPKEEFKTDLDRLKWVERMRTKYNIK